MDFASVKAYIEGLLAAKAYQIRAENAKKT